jgi:CheY-like chemotaxis protein
MDWRMPEMDGLQATRLIQAEPALTHAPAIVIVTAFEKEEVREEAERLQVSGFLLKPVTKSMLVDTLVSIFAPTPDEKRRPSTEVVRPHRLNGIRILLAEDNPINQQIALELLEGAGARVEVVDNGAEAVRKLSSDGVPPRFDLVLMDLQMPEMDGYQATAKIRSEPRFEKLPIVAMTAHATMEERQRCLVAGMNDHVSKPIEPDILYATIERWTKPAEPGPAGSRASSPAPAASDEIPAIEGVETTDGLARVAGNRRLYRNLLEQFAGGQAGVGEEIARALERGDRPVAERLAHTVKGVAGNLAIGRLHNVAGALERAIHDGGTEVTSALAEFQTTLHRQVDAIRAALGGVPPTFSREAPAAPVDAEAARLAVARLRHLLATSDGEASEAFVGVSRVLSGTVGRPRLDALARAIDEFDFEGALAKLDAIARDSSIETTA